MPFWWRRRRRPWFGRFRYRRRRYKTTKRRRRRFPRRRNRRSTRRRFRRKRKVRRKLKKITLKQWQPDSIKKCKIKGLSCLVLGANGRQMFCYTNVANEYTISKAPGGGGFGCELITLKWLYDQYVAHNNIWTATNEYKDLGRYTGCKLTFFRHPYVDFIIIYHLQPPFLLTQYTYPELQPQNALLAKKKKIILSKHNAPNKPLHVTIKIKPPKLMQTKWFFQKELANYPLVQICATACSLNYPRIQPNGQNQILTVYALNPTFYYNSNWAAVNSEGYNYTSTGLTEFWVYHPVKGITNPYHYNVKSVEPKDNKKYYYSIAYDTGLFSPQIMLSSGLYRQQPQSPTEQPQQASLPIIVLRYNPNTDDGVGNEIYLTSIFRNHYDKPTVTPTYMFNGVPLWMGFYGFYNFLIKSSNDKGLMTTHMFVVKSRSLYPISQSGQDKYYPIIDQEFVYGKLPYDEYITATMKKFWYPTAVHQENIINSIVMTGPYMPKFNNITNSTWELTYKYQFFFKWGGPYTTDPIAEDPSKKGTYTPTSTVQQTIQIKNPEKLASESLLHEWDFRRGIVTQTALKRMSENLQTDTSFESDDSETPQKKRKVTKEMPCQIQEEKTIQKCLLSLCEEPTCQEQPETLQQLIQQQQQQQQHLRRNLLKLLTHLKHGQKNLQLQTGYLE
nr:MAG: ORF1 [Torque teno midi virus]